MNGDLNGKTSGPLAWLDGDMPYSTVFGDHFYCRTDGRAECGHVFMAGNDLPERWAAGGQFTIAELGFGTGLNFCETWRQWKIRRKADSQLHYVSFELHPMSKPDIDRSLGRWPELDEARIGLCAAWPQKPEGRIELVMDESTRFSIICGDAHQELAGLPLMADAWYLDGFAPSRNPHMWSAELMQLVFDHTATGGTFATYAAAGQVRRNLHAAGFVVERAPGFAEKREMLRGVKPVADRPEIR